MALSPAGWAEPTVFWQPQKLYTGAMGIGLLASLAAGALWALTFITPVLLPDFGAAAITASRYLVYGLLSALLLVGRPWRALLAQHWRGLLLMAWFGNLFCALLMVVAVQRTGAALTALVLGCLPVTVPLSAVLFGHKLGRARLLRRLAPALLAILGGLLLLQWPALQRGLHPDLWGLAAAFGALLSWNLYALINARYLAQHPDLPLRDWASLVGLGCLALLPSLALLLPFEPALPSAPQAWLWLLVCALLTGLGSAWGANWAWNLASSRLPMALAGQLMVSETLFVLLFSFLYEGRGPNALEAASILLVLGGVLWGVRALRPAQPAQ